MLLINNTLNILIKSRHVIQADFLYGRLPSTAETVTKGKTYAQ